MKTKKCKTMKKKYCKKTKKSIQFRKGGNIIKRVFQNNDELFTAVRMFRRNKNQALEMYGKMETWDVSNITSMKKLFADFEFDNKNDKISNWNVSNVTNMESMFKNCEKFNQLLNDWNVGNVTNMESMFKNCERFNLPLINWNVYKVTNMESMFQNCKKFNQQIITWNVGNVTNMKCMFESCFDFSKSIYNWKVSKVTNMERMFANTNINFSLNNWDVSNVTNMKELFYFCDRFNQPFNDWNVSKVTNMESMFKNCQRFNQPLNDWNVSNVTNMNSMFFECENFNQPLNKWDVSNVTTMELMFYECLKFNQPLNDWNISKVKNMFKMFTYCENFKQPLNWDLSNVTNTEQMLFETPLYVRNQHQQIQPYQIHEPQLPYKTYSTISPKVISVSQNPIQINASTEQYDTITWDTINVFGYINENKKNHVVFLFLNKFHFTTKERLKQSCLDKELVKYKCHKVEHILMVTPNKFDTETPYLIGKAFACHCGLLEMSKIKTIIESQTEEYPIFEIKSFEPKQKALSTTSLEMVDPDPNSMIEYGIGRSHCQEGQEEEIRDVLRIII